MSLTIKIHEDVYKVQDPRIKKITTGAMSLEHFVATISPDDPFVLVHDTVYVMTEQEYYSTRAVYPTHRLMDHMFTHIMQMQDLSVFSENDRKCIEKARKDYPECPRCQQKKYRKKFYELGLKYNLESELNDCLNILQRVPRYPKVNGEIKPTLSFVSAWVHNVPESTRKGCIACVEKHLSQAYILAGEVEQGYPEHIVLVCGHLGQAIDELPDEAFFMKQTLEFCMAKTIESGVPVVPLWAILSQLLLVQRGMKPVEDLSDPVYDIGLDVTDEIIAEWKNLTPYMQGKFKALMVECGAAIGNYKENHDERSRFQFSGYMSSAAEMLAPVAPKMANMLRDRRLAFVAAPDLMEEAGYDLYGLVEQLEGSADRTDVRVDLGVEQGVTDNPA